MREEQMNGLEMRAGHGENVGGAIDEGGGERLAAESTDIDARVFAYLHSVETGWLAADSVDSGRCHFNVLPARGEMAKKPFRDGAAANITRADKENAFHVSAARQRTRNET